MKKENNSVRNVVQNSENTLDVNKIHLGDCLELMQSIPKKSIDMILCDLPYGWERNYSLQMGYDNSIWQIMGAI